MLLSNLAAVPSSPHLYTRLLVRGGGSLDQQSGLSPPVLGMDEIRQSASIWEECARIWIKEQKEETKDGKEVGF